MRKHRRGNLLGKTLGDLALGMLVVAQAKPNQMSPVYTGYTWAKKLSGSAGPMYWFLSNSHAEKTVFNQCCQPIVKQGRSLHLTLIVLIVPNQLVE